MTVLAPGAIMPDRFGLGWVIASGCGSASVVADTAVLCMLPSGFVVPTGVLKGWSRAMFKAAVQYRETGGMHCAALALPVGVSVPQDPAAAVSTGGVGAAFPADASYFTVHEDVGKHNAVDKVLGRGFVDLVDFSSACLLTSGRIAADMILKAVAARVPVVVPRSIPTTAAFEIAEASGVTVVGRIGDDEPIVYTRPDRIRL